MNAKQIRLLMVVILASVLAFPRPAAAAGKKGGSTLVLDMKKGSTVQGELLAIKGDRLVLFDQDSLTGLEVGIEEVSRIRIVKPSKFGSGIGTGFLIGAAGGALLGLLSGNDKSGFFRVSAGTKALVYGISFGVLGIPVGGIAGAISGADEFINAAGLSGPSREIVLNKLKGYARTAGEFTKNLEVRPAPDLKADNPPAAPAVREDVRPAEPAAPQTLGRFHLSVTPAYFRASYIGQAKDLMEKIGFKSSVSGSSLFGGGYGAEYPRVAHGTAILIKDVRIEYSVSRLFAFGAAYCPLGRNDVVGRHIVLDQDQRHRVSETYLTASGSGKAFFLTASLFPIPDAFLKKYTVKLTAGIGYASAEIDYLGSQYGYFDDGTPLQNEKKSISKKGLGGLFAAEWIYFFSPRWSLGLNADYKYIPAKIDGFTIDCPYTYYEYGSDPRLESWPANVPAKTLNLGGWGIGLNFGYHF